VTIGISDCKCGWKLPVNIHIEQTVTSCDSKDSITIRLLRLYLQGRAPGTLSITKSSVVYDCPKCGIGLIAGVDEGQSH